MITPGFGYVVRNSPPSVGPINVHAGQSNESQSDAAIVLVFTYRRTRYRIVAAETQRIADGDASPILADASVNPCVKNKLLGNSPMEIGEFRKRSF